MRKRKGALLLAILVLSFSVLAGCSTAKEGGAEQTKEESKADTSKGKLKIGVAMINVTQPFFVDMITGGDDAAEDFGVELDWKSSEGSLDKQISIMENFISGGYDCILVDAVDVVGIQGVVEKAGKAGIPVVTMGQLVETDYNVSTIYSDYTYGSFVTEMLWNAVGKQGKIGLVYGTKGNFTSDERQRGWEDVCGKLNIPNVLKPSNFNPDEGYKAAQNLLTANQDLTGFFSVSDAVTTSVYKAVTDAGKEGQIVVASNDGNPDASQEVKNGKYLCTVLLGAKRVGYWNVKVGVQLAKGEKMDSILYLPSHLIITDETKAKVEGEWRMDTSEISIISPDEGIRLYDDYRSEFGPES